MAARRTTRRLQIEGLEARALMAADLYLDFGTNFQWNAGQQASNFQLEMLTDTRVNAPVLNTLPTQINSLSDVLAARNVDYDRSGSVNYLDADALAQDVADLVARIYEPFAVNVQRVGSANMNQVIDKLDDNSTNDAYLLVGGRIEASIAGLALPDEGNLRDNVAFVFADNLVGLQDVFITDPSNPWEFLATSIANTIAHEAGHTFGVEHLLRLSEGQTTDQNRLSGSDLMFTTDFDKFRLMIMPMRWNGLPTLDGTQNSFDVLANNVGLRSNAPAYVTGTGAHDTILIEGLPKSQARVTVSAFRDAGRTDLIETQSYTINVANGVIVEGGRGNDRIEATNLTVGVTLRGGQGDDELIGANGSDTLEGDSGNDTLRGAMGSDIYLYRGPRYQNLGQDSINDTSGADDMLDFSRLGFGVNVNLASTSVQEIDQRPTTTVILPNGQVQEFTFWGAPFYSRLNLDLTPGTGSTGIENVRGTRFNDRIHGNELDNQLFGFEGSDLLCGYDGLDELFGGIGNDQLRGGNGRDLLFGELGRDQLFGEGGNDVLNGGFDNLLDVLNGGEGADEFVQFFRYVWTQVPTPPYLVRSYNLAEGEQLADFNAGLGDQIVRLTVA